MAGDFPFEPSIRERALRRQRGRCGACNKSITTGSSQGHHIVAQQSVKIDPKSSISSWMTTEDNCVMLCYDCHLHFGHSGNFAKGAMPYPMYYKYTHGDFPADRANWLRRVNRMYNLIYDQLYEKHKKELKSSKKKADT